MLCISMVLDSNIRVSLGLRDGFSVCLPMTGDFNLQLCNDIWIAWLPNNLPPGKSTSFFPTGLVTVRSDNRTISNLRAFQLKFGWEVSYW